MLLCTLGATFDTNAMRAASEPLQLPIPAIAPWRDDAAAPIGASGTQNHATVVFNGLSDAGYASVHGALYCTRACRRICWR